VEPSTATVPPGGVKSFSASNATVFRTSSVSAAVRWSATGGTIDGSGKFKAGKVPGRYRVVATMDNGVSDTASVTVTQSGVALDHIVLSPASLSIVTGDQQQFSVAGVGTDGSSVAITVAFAASGGSITGSGQYTAPQAPGTYVVIASESASGLADTATVTVLAAAKPPTSLVLSPSTVSLAGGATRQYSAVGKASDGTTVALTPTYSATGGTISSTGLYTAGAVAGTFRVIAATTGPALADTSVVTILPPAPVLASVVISPGSASLATGQTASFSVMGKLSDGADTSVAVTFTATGGTISSSGQYTAGSTAGSYRVIAKVTGGTQADTANVTVTAPTPPPPPPPPPPPSSGTLLFDDSFSNYSKWGTEGCDPGTCPWVRTIVGSPARAGSTAAQMELRRTDPSGSCFNCSKRSEITYPKLTGWSRDQQGPFKAGDETWFGFSIYIPGDWVNDAAYTPGGGEILFQLHETPDNGNWNKNRTSFLRLIAEAGNFRWITYASACTAADSCWTAVPQMGGKTDGQMDYIGPLNKGQWTDWAIHAKWSYGADGLLEIYRDGQKVATINGPNNYNTQNAGFFKMGIYKWSWNNTGVPERVVGYDNVRICSGNCGLATISP
jgi:hypothetical protein